MSAPVYTIEEQTVVLPVRIRDAASVYASFLVPASAVKRLLPADLTPLQTIPGRATCTIVGVDYRDGDLGTYHEVGVCFLLRPRHRRGPDLVAMMRNQAPAYIYRLPRGTHRAGRPSHRRRAPLAGPAKAAPRRRRHRALHRQLRRGPAPLISSGATSAGARRAAGGGASFAGAAVGWGPNRSAWRVEPCCARR